MRKLASFVIGIAAIALGVAAMFGLTAYGRSQDKKPEAPVEDSLHVRAAVAQPGDYPVTIMGFGTVAALREVALTPEVSGQVLEVHPAFANGGKVGEGEVILKIDPVPYVTMLTEAEAALRQQELTIERMRQEWENEKARHAALETSAALSERDYARAQELERKGVGSPVEVERAERAKVEAVSTRDLHTRELELFPLRLKEAEALVETVRAAADRARRTLERTELRAPFTGTIQAKRVDLGQYLAAGAEIARLSDHNEMEVVISIDSQDARRWLRYSGEISSEDPAWFPPVEQVPCEIYWTEDETAPPWPGRVERIAAYDANTRMVQLVIRHQPEGGAFPLVAGMFCRVDVPGKTMENVFRLPKESITFDDHVHLAIDNRLKMQAVTVAREENGFAYISEGIAPGDVVVTTRLVDPLDNTLLKVDMAEMPSGADESAQPLL